MVMSFDETQEIEKMKQIFKLDLLKAQSAVADTEHIAKLIRLEKQLEIAKAGGVRSGE